MQSAYFFSSIAALFHDGVWYYAAAMKICLSLLLLFSLASFAQSRPAVASDETQQLLQALADLPAPPALKNRYARSW